MQNKIPNIHLSDGNTIPQLGFGTYKLKDDDCLAGVPIALEVGYTHIDTAQMYQNEKQIGEAIKFADRSQLYITSKCFFKFGYNEIIEDCANTLADLGTEYLDLYLLHWPKIGTNYEDAFRAMKHLMDEGKVKSVGVCNCTIHHLQDMLPVAEKVGIKIVTNQVEFHVLLFQKELLEFCEEQGIKITAHTPLARGNVKDNEVLTQIGNTYGKTASQVALRWLIQHGLIPIPKATSHEHIMSNYEIFDFELSSEDMDVLDAMPQHRYCNPDFAEFDY